MAFEFLSLILQILKCHLYGIQINTGCQNFKEISNVHQCRLHNFKSCNKLYAILILIAIEYKTSFFAGFSNRSYVSMAVNWAIVVIQSRIKNKLEQFSLTNDNRCQWSVPSDEGEILPKQDREALWEWAWRMVGIMIDAGMSTTDCFIVACNAFKCNLQNVMNFRRMNTECWQYW